MNAQPISIVPLADLERAVEDAKSDLLTVEDFVLNAERAATIAAKAVDEANAKFGEVARKLDEACAEYVLNPSELAGKRVTERRAEMELARLLHRKAVADRGNRGSAADRASASKALADARAAVTRARSALASSPQNLTAVVADPGARLLAAVDEIISASKEIDDAYKATRAAGGGDRLDPLVPLHGLLVALADRGHSLADGEAGEAMALKTIAQRGLSANPGGLAGTIASILSGPRGLHRPPLPAWKRQLAALTSARTPSEFVALIAEPRMSVEHTYVAPPERPHPNTRALGPRAPATAPPSPGVISKGLEIAKQAAARVGGGWRVDAHPAPQAKNATDAPTQSFLDRHMGPRR